MEVGGNGLHLQQVVVLGTTHLTVIDVPGRLDVRMKPSGGEHRGKLPEAGQSPVFVPELAVLHDRLVVRRGEAL